jgi:hypothetical protein
MSMDQSLIVYTGSKVLLNKHLLSRLPHEPNNCFLTYSDYKKYIKDYKGKERHLSEKISKISLNKFPDPKVPVRQSGRSAGIAKNMTGRNSGIDFDGGNLFRTQPKIPLFKMF